MKKKLAAIFSSIGLALLMLVTLCACSTYGGIEKKFKNEGLSENKDLVNLQEALLTKALGEDYKSVCTIHALGKDGSALNYVVILEFNSTEEMEKKISESETLKGIVKDAQNSEFINGNCVLVFYTPLGGGNDVFKSSK